MKDKPVPVPSHLKEKKKSSVETEQESMAKQHSSVLNIVSSHVAHFSS